MTELTKEEQEILARLEQAQKAREAIPEDQRTPVAAPEKYASPIGFDDEGRPFPPPEAASSSPGVPFPGLEGLFAAGSLYAGSDGFSYLVEDESVFDPAGDVVLKGLRTERRAFAERLVPYRMDDDKARALVEGKLGAAVRSIEAARDKMNAAAERIRRAGVAVAEGPERPSGAPATDPATIVEMLKEAFAAVPGASGAFAPLVGLVQAAANVTKGLETAARSAQDPERIAALEGQLGALFELAKKGPPPTSGDDPLAREVETRLRDAFASLSGMPLPEAARPPAAKPPRGGKHRSKR